MENLQKVNKLSSLDMKLTNHNFPRSKTLKGSKSQAGITQRKFMKQLKDVRATNLDLRLTRQVFDMKSERL